MKYECTYVFYCLDELFHHLRLTDSAVSLKDDKMVYIHQVLFGKGKYTVNHLITEP